jgi:hypothetical protein
MGQRPKCECQRRYDRRLAVTTGECDQRYGIDPVSACGLPFGFWGFLSLQEDKCVYAREMTELSIRQEKGNLAIPAIKKKKKKKKRKGFIRVFKVG